MSARVVILADDLSGAADCAVACHRAGLASKVRLGPAGPEEPVPALALDLDSRALPPAQALARTLSAQPLARRTLNGQGALYRKIDSTLRGHVALDIAATLRIAGSAAFALVCPAYPATGRTVAGGQVYVDGRPLAETEIWALNGGGPADLMAMLAQGGLYPAGLDLGTVRGGGLGAAIRAARDRGALAVVCDAESEADLAAIVAAGLPMPGVVWAGSGGLTIPLARAIADGEASQPPPAARRAGPTLVVVGSASSVSRGQWTLLGRDPAVHTLMIAPQALLEGPEGPGWRPASRALVAAVGKAGKDVVAVAIDPAAPVEPGVGPVLAARLGALVGRQLGRFGALAATGGETARAVLDAADVHALSVRQALEPGVVLSMAGGLPVVTKPGAFGGEASLARAVQVLRALPRA
jgi:uncharacterized protein YgbK (DUF1537 family)